MKAKLSNHCLHRVIEHTGLPVEDVERILDENLYVPTGRSLRSRDVAYKLFYSTHDRCYYVALQNELSGVVVTILPIHYCWRLKIQVDAMRMARELVEPPAKHGEWAFFAHVETPLGFQTVSIGVVDALVDETPADVVENPDARAWVESRIETVPGRVLGVAFRRKDRDQFTGGIRTFPLETPRRPQDVLADMNRLYPVEA